MPNAAPTAPAISLIYAAPTVPIPPDRTVAARIAEVNRGVTQEMVAINWTARDASRGLGSVSFADHQVRLATSPVPLPAPTLDRTVNVSHWQPQLKAALRQHQSHLVCAYQGGNPDPVEQMLALYSTAHAFNNESLLGVVNEAAWTAHPRGDFLKPEKILTYRDSLPFFLWIGYVKFFVDKEHYWFVTKGHHIFDVPDLTRFLGPEDDSLAVMDQFINIFYYLYEQDVSVTPGDTLEIAGEEGTLRFAEVPEYEDFLMGPSGTLVIEHIPPTNH